MRTTTLAASLPVVLLAATAPAQLAGPGLTWTGTTSGFAGSYLASCTSLPINGSRGESVTLRVWGDPQALFALFASAGATQCLPFPGIGNGLVLDLPVTTATIGLLTQVSPCLACPPGFEPITFQVPAGIPIGTAVAFQAATSGNRSLSFTVAIAATVP